jgi:hypothetical protein
MTQFVSNLRQVGGFLRVLRFPPPTDRHNITEILLKVTLPKQIYKLRPYMGNDFSVDEKVESYNVDEETLNNFIHRLVLSCALQEAGENGEDRIGK